MILRDLLRINRRIQFVMGGWPADGVSDLRNICHLLLIDIKRFHRTAIVFELVIHSIHWR